MSRGFQVVGATLSPNAMKDGDRMMVWLRVYADGSTDTNSAHLSELREVLAAAEKQASESKADCDSGLSQSSATEGGGG